MAIRYFNQNKYAKCTLMGVSVVASFACSRPRVEREAIASKPNVVGHATAGPSSSVGAATTAAAPSSVPIATGTAIAATAVSRPPADANVLVISIDSLRADMPWAGYPRPIAPRLTELAGKCVNYTHAYSISSYTAMSLGGFLGGKIPSELKRDGRFFGFYSKDNVFFPELLHDAKVATVAAQAHTYFQMAGFDQGFDKWEIVPGLRFNSQTDENVTSPAHEAIAEKLLSDSAVVGGRFFAWFHFLDPHDEYKPHDKDGIAYGHSVRDMYDGEVEYTDRYVGKLLDFVAKQPWAARTAIIVTSDHGEPLGEHGAMKHGFELWENLVRVPLFLCMPGAAPRKIDAKRSAVDLAPTILDVFGLPKAEGYVGNSLVAESYGAVPADDHDIVVDLPTTDTSAKRRALVHENLKYTVYGDGGFARMFDLAADPKEEKPISKGEAFDAMKERLRAYEATVKEVPTTSCGRGCLFGTK